MSRLDQGLSALSATLLATGSVCMMTNTEEGEVALFASLLAGMAVCTRLILAALCDHDGNALGLASGLRDLIRQVLRAELRQIGLMERGARRDGQSSARHSPSGPNWIGPFN